MTEPGTRALPDYDPPLKQCPACESADTRPDDRDFRGNCIWRCARCGTRFMNPPYSDRHLRDYYAGYITSETPERLAWRRRQKEAHLRVLARFCPSGRCLCVGCGDGLELAVAREMGYEVEGCDVDPATTRRVSEALGVPVHAGFLADLNLPEGAYDGVYMDQVLEHLNAPRPALLAARRLLRPNGILYVGLPNIGSASCRLKMILGKMGLKRASRGRHYGSLHHLLYFAPRPFRNLLSRFYDFEVLQVSGDPAPSRGVLRARLERRFPILGSTFILIARKPGLHQQGETASCANDTLR